MLKKEVDKTSPVDKTFISRNDATFLYCNYLNVLGATFASSCFDTGQHYLTGLLPRERAKRIHCQINYRDLNCSRMLAIPVTEYSDMNQSHIFNNGTRKTCCLTEKICD